MPARTTAPDTTYGTRATGVRAQFFLSYAVYGSLTPFLAAYLEADRGLTRPQIGYVTGAGGLAILFTPVLTTLLADAHIPPRRLLGSCYAIMAAALAGMLVCRGFVGNLVCYGVFSLAFAPVIPLQDGLKFQLDRQHAHSGVAIIPYHRVRVWGSVGFEAPGLLLFVLLAWGLRNDAILGAAIFCCAIGLLNSFRLPAAKAPVFSEVARSSKPDSGVPTLGALRACLEPHVLVFCLAMLLVNVALGAYYTFYPTYLHQRIGLETKWLGLIANVGVTVEIFFMLGFGRLLGAFGLRTVMVLGALAVALRLGLLAAAPIAAVAVGTQVLHGLQVLILHVAPPVYLNHKASDVFRCSMQGLYTMVVTGGGRMLGSVLGGYVAAVSLLQLFWWGAALSALAAAILLLAFHDQVGARPDNSRQTRLD